MCRSKIGEYDPSYFLWALLFPTRRPRTSNANAQTRMPRPRSGNRGFPGSRPGCPDHLKKKRGGPGIRVATQMPEPPTGPPLTLGGLGIWVATQVASDEKRFSSKMMCFQLNSNLPLVLSNPKGENQAPSTRIRRRRIFNTFSTSIYRCGHL